MIKEFDFDKLPEAFANHKTSELGENLDKLQRLAQAKSMPVLILLDGWESSGKGYVLKDLTREMDPRYVRVEAFEALTDEEQAHPVTWKFWQRIPSRQEIAVFDRSFYYTVMNNLELSKKALKKQLKDIQAFESALIKDGYLVIKFFLNISKDQQMERIKELEKSPQAEYLLSDNDYYQNKKYKKHRKHFDYILEQTHTSQSPWHIINAEDVKLAAKEVLGQTIQCVEQGLAQQNTLADHLDKSVTQEQTKIHLETMDISKTLSKEDYDDQKEDLQAQAADLVYQAYQCNIPIVLAFEGVDAAGKGGSIQRLTRLMDPRNYKIFGIKAPTQEELNHHYLWRFQTKFPRDGYMTIFDRSWYGRVLVERIEGFAGEAAWTRAYEEINTMEEVLSDHGAIVLKFFLYIDKDEQAQRFKDRQDNPDKNYKITDEDWRNREKWDAYIQAYEDMLALTDTDHAPWKIIASNDKYFARIEVLKEFIAYVQEQLDKRKEDK